MILISFFLFFYKFILWDFKIVLCCIFVLLLKLILLFRISNIYIYSTWTLIIFLFTILVKILFYLLMLLLIFSEINYKFLVVDLPSLFTSEILDSK